MALFKKKEIKVEPVLFADGTIADTPKQQQPIAPPQQAKQELPENVRIVLNDFSQSWDGITPLAVANQLHMSNQNFALLEQLMAMNNKLDRLVELMEQATK